MRQAAHTSILVAAAVLALSCGGGGSPAVPAPQATGAVTAPSPTPPAAVRVRIRDLVIRAETAVTAEERGQGLSGRPFLAEDAGMLFFLQEERVPGFHMRNMQFPLDFIWISAEGSVADLTEDVPHPEAAGGETLSAISPRVPVLFVLEVNAGVVEAGGIQVGDVAEFEPDIIDATSQ